MPRHCSVIGCKSNYKSQGECVTTFALPLEKSLRQKWINKIPTDLTTLKNPVVCIKHFRDSDIIKIDKCRVGGELIEFPRKIPKLKADAVPTIFKNIPNSQIIKPLPTRAIFLPECREQYASTSVDPGQESSLKIGASHSLQVNPDRNIGGAQLELLPETSQGSVEAMEPKCAKPTNKVYCRLCLKSANRVSLTPLSAVDFNYPGKSEAFKKEKLEEIQELQKMIKLCLPFFDSLTFNPVLCNLCQRRLKTAYTFINQCFETQQIISDYVNACSTTEKVVNLNNIIDSDFISLNKISKTINNRIINPTVPSFSHTKNRKSHIKNRRINAKDPLKYNQTGSDNGKSKLTANDPKNVDQTGVHNEVDSYSSSSSKRSKLHNTHEETVKSTIAPAEEMVIKCEPNEDSVGLTDADVIKIESDYNDYPDLVKSELTYDERLDNMGNSGTDIETPVRVISQQQSFFFENMGPLEQMPDQPTT